MTKRIIPIFFIIYYVKALGSNLPNEVVAAAASLTLPLGSPCDFTSQCINGAYCGHGRCRKNACHQNYECAKGELCHYGKTDDQIQSACFPFLIDRDGKDEYCPGGGRPITNAGGFVETCDLDMPCLGHSICNPIYGICCSKLRACPYPRQPVLESDTHRPVICQLRGNRQLECPVDSQCEKSTGFCCTNKESIRKPPTLPEQPEIEVELPKPGERCEEGDECQGNAVCECEHGLCHCQCLRTMGYMLDAENHVCKRTRRRLKEKCKFDMDCQSAFSECSSGGCRCKAGFQRDNHGGCMSIGYKCVNHAEPLKFDDKVVPCVASKLPISREIDEIEFLDDALIEVTTLQTTTKLNVRKKRETKDCPSHYYCVPIFDMPKQPNLYQGFCCPLPDDRPVCPVGNPHSSSQAPDYGCDECPWDYYCHQDPVSTRKKICCPKPCLSPEDIYSEGQCLSIAYHGDSCFTNEQCVGKLNDENEKPETYEFEITGMECSKKGICTCPSGFLFVDNVCKKLQCTVGTKSAPSLDTSGNVIRCHKTSDCNQGQICDKTINACCKGQNHCPKGYLETGQECETETCAVYEICFRSRKGKKRICCKQEQD